VNCTGGLMRMLHDSIQRMLAPAASELIAHILQRQAKLAQQSCRDPPCKGEWKVHAAATECCSSQERAYIA
jgi:hypothetical protein